MSRQKKTRVLSTPGRVMGTFPISLKKRLLARTSGQVLEISRSVGLGLIRIKARSNRHLTFLAGPETGAPELTGPAVQRFSVQPPKPHGPREVIAQA